VETRFRIFAKKYRTIVRIIMEGVQISISVCAVVAAVRWTTWSPTFSLFRVHKNQISYVQLKIVLSPNSNTDIHKREALKLTN
jgi:Na+-transporting NADH:ubiquinone oxidoreductase subunit NqrB